MFPPSPPPLLPSSPPPIGLIKETLALDKEIRTLAEDLHKQKSLIVMGRGYNFATCLEGALVCVHVYTMYCGMYMYMYMYMYP